MPADCKSMSETSLVTEGPHFCPSRQHSLAWTDHPVSEEHKKPGDLAHRWQEKKQPTTLWGSRLESCPNNALCHHQGRDSLIHIYLSIYIQPCSRPCSNYLRICPQDKSDEQHFMSFVCIKMKDIPSSIALHKLLSTYLNRVLRNLGWNRSHTKILKTPIKQKASEPNTLGRDKL